MSVKARKVRGFTLLEVLIALAIIALGLSAAVRATTQVISGAEQMRLRTLATWVAEDRLAEHAARRSWLAPGQLAGTALQANMQFAWRETVTPASEPSLRWIEISVAAATQPDYVLARLTGVLLLREGNP